MWTRKIVKSAVYLGIAAIIWRKTTNHTIKVLAIVTGVLSILSAAKAGIKMFQPLPWEIDKEIYNVLASQLPYQSANRTLDIGCGTGRSLVGLAPHIPKSCSITVIDVFTEEIILGNSPQRARTNAQKAGHDVAVLTGDATQLPFADNTQDIITICRVLHDLSAVNAQQTLEEAVRVCTSTGTVGIIELPLTHDQTTEPEQYWKRLVEKTGFVVKSTDRLPWKGNQEYVILTACPAEDSIS